MNNEVIRNDERKKVKGKWFEGKSTFPLTHQNNQKIGYGVLQLIGDINLKSHQRIPNHFQSNMEVLTYVVKGKVVHVDSLDNEMVLSESIFQKISTGRGIFHTEYNAMEESAELLQVWITPETSDEDPSYDEIALDQKFGCTDLVLAISGSGRDGSMKINQDVDIYVGRAMMDGEKLINTFRYRKCWLQVIKGDVSVNDERLKTGDGIGIDSVDELFFKWKSGSHFIIFDLPT